MTASSMRGYGVKGYGPEWKRLFEQKGWWHSFELPDGTVIEGVNSVASLKERLAQFPIPQDLRGRRVLDIGAWDGWFSFEMERRGAEVVAVDCFDNPRFREIHKVYGSQVDYRVMDMFEISPDTVGRFDYALMLGVLYHLKHPVLALEKVCAVATEMAVVESYILPGDVDPAAKPVLEFYESEEFEGQSDNWCAPNLACLMSMCRAAGFARVELQHVQRYGACVACYRRWKRADPSGPSAETLGAVHMRNGGINFDTRKDEYVMARFRAPFQKDEGKLGRDEIQPSVGGYGVFPLSAAFVADDVWQVNFKLPPGLTAGWHDATVGVRGGPSSGACRIAVDIPLPQSAPRIEAVCDGTTWARDVLDLSAGRSLAIWCAGLPDNADRSNVHVLVNGLVCPADVPISAENVRQVNATVPEDVGQGSASVRVRIGNQTSEPVAVEIKR